MFHSKPFKLVPLKEMVDAITVSKKAKPLLGESCALTCGLCIGLQPVAIIYKV